MPEPGVIAGYPVAGLPSRSLHGRRCCGPERYRPRPAIQVRLDEHSRAADLLDLANDAEVADLIAMRDLARERLLPALPAGPVDTGMTFDGSADLNADADLIAGGMLIDFKAGQGSKPRADGTRAASLGRADLDQLLGYALMDYSDTFALHTVGLYAVRFGYLAAWPLPELDQLMGGQGTGMCDLRAQFAQVLRTQLPPYRDGAAGRAARHSSSGPPGAPEAVPRGADQRRAR